MSARACELAHIYRRRPFTEATRLTGIPVPSQQYVQNPVMKIIGVNIADTHLRGISGVRVIVRPLALAGQRLRLGYEKIRKLRWLPSWLQLAILRFAR